MMAEKYFHLISGSDTTGDGTISNPYKSYDVARAAAGSDEVWVGGAGTGTWSKIRFVDSDNGSDANYGLTPDQAWKTLAEAWALTPCTDSPITSYIILAKGSFTERLTLLKGGSYGQTPVVCKMLKGYTGNDYFGSGKCSVIWDTTSGLGHIFTSCSYSIFKNITFIDTSNTSFSLFISGVSSGISYYMLFENCDFLNFGRAAVYCHNLLRYVNFLNCYFWGRMATGEYDPGVAVFASLPSGANLYNCYIGNVSFGMGSFVQSMPTAYSLKNCIIDRCGYGVSGGVNGFENSIISNCNIALDFKYNSFARLTNSIIYNSQPSDFISSDNNLPAILTNCCLWNGSASETETFRKYIGPGCFVADPLFVDAANGDFRLKSASSCWNMGLANSFINENIAHIGAENKEFRGSVSRGNIYANTKQIVCR
jgi:hypothetical protein